MEIGIIVIAVLTLVVNAIAAIYTVLQKKRKTLTYDYNGVSLMSVKPGVKEKIEVRFDNIKVPDPYYLVILIANSGNEEIRKEEYVHPISFTFDEDTKIINCSVVEADPDILMNDVTTDIKQNTLLVNPITLNAQSEIVLKLVLSKFDNTVRADAYITGCRFVKGRSTDLDKRIDKAIKVELYQAFFMAPTFIIINSLNLIFSGVSWFPAIINVLMSLTIIMAGLFVTLSGRQVKKMQDEFSELE